MLWLSEVRFSPVHSVQGLLSWQVPNGRAKRSYRSFRRSRMIRRTYLQLDEDVVVRALKLQSFLQSGAETGQLRGGLQDSQLEPVSALEQISLG